MRLAVAGICVLLAGFACGGQAVQPAGDGGVSSDGAGGSGSSSGVRGGTDAGSDVRTDDSGEASTEAGPPDAGACMFDAGTVVCCCDGDIGGTVVCDADGAMSCYSPPFTGLKIYFGDDCTRECGPCSVICYDAGRDGGGNEATADGSDGGPD